MPIEMTKEELVEAIRHSQKADSFEYRAEDDEDDWFTASLYVTPKQKHFRVVELSGYSSIFGGAGEIGEWLEKSEVENWADFDY